MKKALAKGVLWLLTVFCAAVLSVSPAEAQGTAFTYQGSLEEGGAHATGQYDFRFRLFDAASDGLQVGSTLCVDDVAVVNGVFTTQLDFGQQYATTAQRYLEIEVRLGTGVTCADGSGFALLTPRQRLTAAPMASHANSAFALDAADGSPGNAVYVDDAGRVGLGTTSPAKLLHLRTLGPVMILQDTAAASNQAGYVTFWNDASVETAWMGFGSPGSPHFSIVNARSGGSINIEAITVTSGGLVGIGTTSPTTKLDVRGDVRLGSTGQYYAPGGAENLRILRGRISSTGAVLVGSGFTASRTGTGLYVITYSTAFSGTPVLTLSPAVGSTGGPYGAHTNGVLTTSAGVRITTASGTNIDDTFDFILIGPR